VHTLSHTREGLEVVWVAVVRGSLLLLEHHLGLSVESLKHMQQTTLVTVPIHEQVLFVSKLLYIYLLPVPQHHALFLRGYTLLHMGASLYSVGPITVQDCDMSPALSSVRNYKLKIWNNCETTSSYFVSLCGTNMPSQCLRNASK